ncbi:hypothetical protein KKC13_08630 [bacterium]|nr:hypothetical protein [bacterium]MBU1958816.1 hypothetical protein [bacterium]
MNADELRDIKPLLEIPDYSYTIFIVLASFMVLIIFTLLFILGKRLWETRKVNMRKVYFERLKTVDWSNSKKAAYEVTFFGRALCNELRIEEIYNQLLPLLERYKYKKEVPEVDEETKRAYNLLVHVVDESI